MDTNSNNLTLECLRQSRNLPSAVFTDFTLLKEKYPDYTFCFFEGEDGKYYNSRISLYLHDKFIPLVANNKKNVLFLLKKITEDSSYNCINKMFFVDRDYDDSLSGSNKDLFETPCYSIENFYSQKFTFCQILKTEFGLNEFNADYKKCVNVYEERLTEFNSIILKFNALVKYKHTYANDSHCYFSSIKTSNLVNIHLESVKKSNSYEKEINKIKNSFELDESKLIEIETELGKGKNKELIFRGKNQLDFMVSIIKELLNANNKEDPFFSQKLTRVHLDITNNRLSELSQYAITPPELISFLKSHNLST